PANRTGCSGGMPEESIEFVINHGIAYRDTYPYMGWGLSGFKRCQKFKNETKTSYKLTAVQRVNKGKDAELLNALVNVGPISVSTFVSQNFVHHKKGVLEDELCEPSSPINHAMVLVGYGNENGKDYWLIRNSWGESKGEKGYFKLARNIANHCQISRNAYIPRAKDLLRG
ncbi:unnamed protein product, partial [Meganyctiphanes norvegica]